MDTFLTQGSPPAEENSALIIATIIVIISIGLIALALIALRAIYRFITKKPKEKRTKIKNCDFCIDNYILCKHYGTETPTVAEYCPICGRKLN